MQFITNYLKSHIFVEGLGTLLINVINKLLLLILSIILFRTLGKEQFGVYSYVQSIVFILIIPAEFGIFNLVVKEIARAVSQKNHNLVKGVYYWASKTGIIISLTITVVAFIILLVFWEKISYIERMTFFWGLAFVPIFTLEHINSAALQGLKKITLGQLPKVLLFPILYIVLIVVFGEISTDKLNAVTATALKTVSLVISLIFAIFLFINNLPNAIRDASPTYHKKAWLLSLLPLGLSSGLNIIKNRTSIIILGLFSSAGDVGVFQVAISTAEVTALLLYVTNLVLAPQFSSLFFQGKMKQLQRLVTISARLIIIFNVLISIIFVIWGRFILTLLYGPNINSAFPVLIILLIGQMINSLAGSVAYLLNMTGHENEVLKAIGITSIISIISNVMFINLWGSNGAALANSLSMIVAQILMFNKVRKRLGINSSAFGKLA